MMALVSNYSSDLDNVPRKDTSGPEERVVVHNDNVLLLLGDEQEVEEESLGEKMDTDNEEEDDNDDYDDDEDTYYLPQQHSSLVLSNEEENLDDVFYLANKTFYTTCHKISHQNSSSYRKKPPYSFLENWLIHSIFSKSQQILLRLPVIHPKVMMTEGDFIYTPHQMAHSNDDDMLQADVMGNEEYDEEYDYYEDTFVIGDEGVMVMSASAPDTSEFLTHDEDVDDNMMLIMNENTWMGNGKYNKLHVVNPDNDEEDKVEDPMYHTKSNYKPIMNIGNNTCLQAVQEEEEEEDEEDENNEEEEEEEKEKLYQEREESEDKEELENETSNSSEGEQLHYDQHKPTANLSPETLSWYKSTESTIAIPRNSSIQQEETCTNNNCECSSTLSCGGSTTEEKLNHRHSGESYQSLADIIISMDESGPLQEDHHYGTMIQTKNYDIEHISNSKNSKIPPLMQVSLSLVDAALVAMDIGQQFVESNQVKGISDIIKCVFKIWKALFLGAETMMTQNYYQQPRAKTAASLV